MLDLKALLLKLVQHYNSIGSGDVYQEGTNSDALSSSTTTTTIGTVSNMAAGTWICSGYINWTAAANGFRAVELGYTKSGGSLTKIPVSLVAIPAVSGTYGVFIQCSCAIKSDTTWSLHVLGCQSSTTTMAKETINWTLKAIRIK